MKELLTSKKFQVALAAMIAAILARWGWNVDLETIMTVLSPLMLYIVGQAAADHGKEVAKIKADAEIEIAKIQMQANGSPPK